MAKSKKKSTRLSKTVTRRAVLDLGDPAERAEALRKLEELRLQLEAIKGCTDKSGTDQAALRMGGSRPRSPSASVDLNAWHRATHQVTGDMAIRFNRATIDDLKRWAGMLRAIADEMDRHSA
jgi:hypothetical protein